MAFPGGPGLAAAPSQVGKVGSSRRWAGRPGPPAGTGRPLTSPRWGRAGRGGGRCGRRRGVADGWRRGREGAGRLGGRRGRAGRAGARRARRGGRCRRPGRCGRPRRGRPGRARRSRPRRGGDGVLRRRGGTRAGGGTDPRAPGHEVRPTVGGELADGRGHGGQRAADGADGHDAPGPPLAGGERVRPVSGPPPGPAAPRSDEDVVNHRPDGSRWPPSTR